MNVISQSFDGAGNMRAIMKTVKTLIQRGCHVAFYIWWYYHRFSFNDSENF